MKAMILAAGLGTRLKPFTDKHPKALAIVNGKTLLERNITYLASHGVTKLIINVHHFADQIISFLQANNHFGLDIVLSDEQQEVLETGGGLQKASWFFDDGHDFVLMNVDILTTLNLTEMLHYHQQKKALATLAISGRESSRCFLWDDENRLCGWRNKASGEEKISRPVESLHEMAFGGIHIIDPALCKYLTQGGKYSIVDTYLMLAEQHHICGYDHSDAVLLDVGKPESIVKAESLFP